MITKGEMDIIKNLARNQVRPYVELDELINEGVRAVLEARTSGEIANEGILIAIVRRAMINLKLGRKYPVTVPEGSRYHVYTKGGIPVVELDKIEKARWQKYREHNKKMALRVALRIAREKSGDGEVFDAFESGSDRDVVDFLGEERISMHHARKFKEKVRLILKKMGF